MNRKNINFDDKKIRKLNFIKIKKYVIQMILILIKQKKHGKYNSFKYFIRYNDNDVIRPLCLGLSQMTGYINKFDENKNKITMSLMVKDE